jgi:E3 ubiquitin-protein ligase RNF14
VPLLASHDLKVKSDNFSRSTYSCAICLTEHKGYQCVQLDCSHIFCRSCLGEYWGLLVSEGDADRVKCPDSACIKDGREAGEEEARKILTEPQVERLIWLREKRELEKGI